MKPQRSRWYWTEQDFWQELNREAEAFIAELRLYTKDDIARIAGYIESCGGVVGGADERESLRCALGLASKIWLRPDQRLTERKINQTSKALRRAIKNADLLCSTLGTKDAAHHAAAVAADLDGVGLCTFRELKGMNYPIRQLLPLYISLLKREEKRIRTSIPDTVTRPSLASRGIVVKTRRAKLWDWISELARIWEISGLPVNMGREFQGFVKECLPNEERCKDLSLERPRPINKRTVIDWIAKVRQPQERKL